MKDFDCGALQSLEMSGELMHGVNSCEKEGCLFAEESGGICSGRFLRIIEMKMLGASVVLFSLGNQLN